MIHECVSSAHAESADLRGHRIGFFSGSSGEIFAGDSVILADAIEAVYHAGADVTCWAPAGAAIRRALHERRIGIDIRDWPRVKQAAVSVHQSSTTPGKAALTSRLWRRFAPRSVR